MSSFGSTNRSTRHLQIKPFPEKVLVQLLFWLVFEQRFGSRCDLYKCKLAFIAQTIFVAFKIVAHICKLTHGDMRTGCESHQKSLDAAPNSNCDKKLRKQKKKGGCAIHERSKAMDISCSYPIPALSPAPAPAPAPTLALEPTLAPAPGPDLALVYLNKLVGLMRCEWRNAANRCHLWL